MKYHSVILCPIRIFGISGLFQPGDAGFVGFFRWAGAQEMVLQGDVSDWLPGSQVAISATEYPSPPQTTETEVWLGMAGMAAKRSLFFWGKCFAKIF